MLLSVVGKKTNLNKSIYSSFHVSSAFLPCIYSALWVLRCMIVCVFVVADVSSDGRVVTTRQKQLVEDIPRD